MAIILAIIALFAFFLNLNAPATISNMSSTALLMEFLGVLVVAFIMIKRMIPNRTVRHRYMCFFLISMTISLLILHFYWTPLILDDSGFDPVRYYNYATAMVRGQIVIEGLNYWGVVFFYYALFTIFGLDPLVPLLLNSLLVLYVVLLLSRFLNKIGILYKTTSILLLIPEIVFYNVMSSREILCMVFGVYVILNFYLVYNKEISKMKIIPALFILLLMIVIRPPYGIGAVLVVGLYILFSTKEIKKIILYVAIILGIVVVGVYAAGNIGDTSSDVSESLSSAVENRVGGDNMEGDDFTYSQNSMAAKLIPHNPVQFVVYGLIRTMAYVIITPADITDPLGSFNLITDKTGYIEWTTLFMMLLIPGVYKTIINSFKKQKEVKLLTFSFLVFFLMVGVFNTTLIQQRYRLVYDLFYFSLALIYISRRKHFKLGKVDVSHNNFI